LIFGHSEITFASIKFYIFSVLGRVAYLLEGQVRHRVGYGLRCRSVLTHPATPALRAPARTQKVKISLNLLNAAIVRRYFTVYLS
jgi:hypothetical protein